MKKLETAYADLMSWMVQNPQEVLKVRAELQETLIKRRCVQSDSVLQTALMPLFLRPRSLALISRVAEVLDTVIDRVLNLYDTSAEVQESFPEHMEIPRAWLSAPVPYPKPTVLNRLDLLFDGETLKFIEFNTDNPGGRGWCDTIDATFKELPIYRELIDFSEVANRPILARQLEAVRACFAQSGMAGPPRVALLSFESLGGRGDDEIVRDYFIEHGVEANLIDPRDFELRDGRLLSNGVAFNVLVRTMTAPFFLRYPREMRDLIDGVKQGAAVMVNSFRATLGSQKSMLSFITNPLNHHHFTPEQVDAITRYVPWTRRFDETVTLSPEGAEVSIKAYMLKNRETLVIKPSAGAGGEGVMVGVTTDALEWREVVEDYIGCPDWVVQSYVPVPKIELPVIAEGKVVMEERFFNLSPYVFGGRLAGILGRVSSRDVVNVHAGGGLIPVYPLRSDDA